MTGGHFLHPRVNWVSLGLTETEKECAGGDLRSHSLDLHKLAFRVGVVFHPHYSVKVQFPVGNAPCGVVNILRSEAGFHGEQLFLSRVGQSAGCGRRT